MAENQDNTAQELRRIIAELRTELAEARKDLAKASFFDLLIENMPHHVFCKDLSGRFTYANHNYLQLHKLTLNDLLGKTDFDIHTPEAAHKYRADDQRVLDTGQPFHCIEQHVALDGHAIYTEVIKTPLRDHSGQPRGIMGIFWDVTDQKIKEKALRQSEAQYRSILNNIQDVYYRTDLQGRLTLVSPSGLTVFGYASMDEVLGVPITSFYLEPTKRQEFLHILSSQGSVRDYEVTVVKKDGTPIIIATHSNYYYDEQGTLLGVEGVVCDITERKKAELELARAKNYLDQIINSMPSTLIGVDMSGHVTQWNLGAVHETGTQTADALGHKLDQLLPRLASEMPNVYLAIREQRVIERPKIMSITDDQPRYDNMTIYPLVIEKSQGAVIRMDNVTDRVRMEEFMVHSEEMMSVGGIAAGIAHEINNPLGIVLQAAQNVLMKTQPDFPKNVDAAARVGIDMHKLQAYMRKRKVDVFLEDIRTAAIRAAEIVRNMLDFCRRSESRRSLCHIPDLIEKSLGLAARDFDLKKNYDFLRITIEKDIPADLPSIMCTETEIEQVLLNLFKNAAQAIPESEAAPRISIRASRAQDGVRIEIADNGPGISLETQRRIFEPFFTSKPPGIGTGLGLSVSYFIITTGHSGKMYVVSEPGHGSRFFIELPLT